MAVKTAKKRRKPGRKRAIIDWEQVEKLATIGCTQEEIASILGIGLSTLKRRAVEQDFELRRHRGEMARNASLRRMQWKRAQAGSDRMLEWLGIQYLKQRHRYDVQQEISGVGGRPIEVVVDFSSYENGSNGNNNGGGATPDG